MIRTVRKFQVGRLLRGTMMTLMKYQMHMQGLNIKKVEIID